MTAEMALGGGATLGKNIGNKQRILPSKILLLLIIFVKQFSFDLDWLCFEEGLTRNEGALNYVEKGLIYQEMFLFLGNLLGILGLLS